MWKLLILLWLGCIVEGKVDLFTYERFHGSNSEPPVYVEKMEEIKIYSKKWKIVTSIDMTFNDNEYQHFQSLIINISTLCTTLGTVDMQLNTMYGLFSGCTESIRILNNTIQGMENSWRNHKLATIEIQEGVNIFDAAELIYTLQKNKQQSLLMINDTTFIKENSEFLGKNSYELSNQREKIVGQIGIIEKVLNKNLKLELKGAMIKHYVQELISYATTLILDFIANQVVIFDTLSSRKVLPSTTLLHVLQNLEQFISPKELELPFNIRHESANKFYDVATTYSTIINKQLLIVFILPIVEPVLFHLYHLQSYPRKVDNVSLFQIMLPEIQQIALNIHSRQYFIMDDSVLEKCYNNNNNTLLCELMRPIISTEESGSCAVELLTKAKLSRACNYRIMNFDHEIWFELVHANSWLFVFPTSEEVIVNCNGDIDVRFVKGAGILRIHSKCSIKTKHIEITASDRDIWQRRGQRTEKVELAAEMEINWEQILDAVSKMAVNLTHNLVPRVIHQKESQLLGKFSMSIDNIVIKSEGGTSIIEGRFNLEMFTAYIGIILSVFSIICSIIAVYGRSSSNKKKQRYSARTINKDETNI